MTYDESNIEAWKPLRFLNIYRVVLSILFLTSVQTSFTIPLLGRHEPDLFAWISTLYLLASLVGAVSIHWRWFRFKHLVHALGIIDIVVLTILMHASGGIKTGLGMLVIVAVAGNSLLLTGRSANLFASIAAISILCEQVYTEIEGVLRTHYTQAGFLGATLFATAILSHVLSKRLRDSEALAAQRGIDLANLAQLNDHVIKRMQSGVIVVDANNRIRLLNQSALHMLGLPNASLSKSLASYSPELNQCLSLWQDNHSYKAEIINGDGNSMDILPSFTQLGKERDMGTLIFLEDPSRLAQQAQQMKLASLGRLTASIAHEIRNPLGAISHAEQLLAESKNLDPADKRLAQIIHNHTNRVNAIIENVLQLSRRGNIAPEVIELGAWLDKFVQEFILSQGTQVDEIVYSTDPKVLYVRMDPTQLHQIVWNLSHNGLKFSNAKHKPRLELRAGIDHGKTRTFLDILDNGPGIAPVERAQIFEPFYTTDSKGSGLGLYIAKELCELNQAHLHYLPTPSGGSCFRIDFTAQAENEENMDVA